MFEFAGLHFLRLTAFDIEDEVSVGLDLLLLLALFIIRIVLMSIDIFICFCGDVDRIWILKWPAASFLQR